MPPNDKAARARLEKLAKAGVKAGLWTRWMQRPPHLVPALRSQPWWSKADFPWCALLERNYPAIRQEVLALLGKPKDTFTPVGGRAAHDHTLVAAGEWREFPLFGNGQRYEDNCARCPVTTKTMECVPAAMELSMAAGGETLFSTLKPGTHLRPHCGSTNTRLTCHLGVVIPPGCSIRAGEEWRGWKEGECIVFDDSWEHEVQHKGRPAAVMGVDAAVNLLAALAAVAVFAALAALAAVAVFAAQHAACYKPAHATRLMILLSSSLLSSSLLYPPLMPRALGPTGDSDRIVLLINFWHPDLPADARRIDINTHGYEAI